METWPPAKTTAKSTPRSSKSTSSKNHIPHSFSGSHRRRSGWLSTNLSPIGKTLPRLRVLLPGPLRNETPDEYHQKSEPEKDPIERDDGNQVQHAGDCKSGKEDSVNLTVDPSTGSTVYQATYPSPRDSRHPENPCSGQG